MTLKEIEELQNEITLLVAETAQNIEAIYYKPKWFAEKKETLRIATQIFENSLRMLEQLKRECKENEKKK